MDLLVVEDDTRMASLLERGLRKEGHVATLATGGSEGYQLARSHDYDVVILDVMLPEMDGFQVARRLRGARCKTPILILTAKDGLHDVVTGLDSGADDYLTKPFSFEELLARVRSVARRGPIPRGIVLELGNLRLYPASHEVWRGERKLRLTRKEFQLLELMTRAAGRVLTRDTIIQSVWSDADVELNTVDVFISSLRRKVDGERDPRLIHTIRGIGFCLRETAP